MGAPAILLADDHTLVLEALKKLLEPEFAVVGTVSDARDLLAVAQTSKPDIVVLDIGLPQASGLEIGPKLKRLSPKTKVIVLTMNEDVEIAREALRLWASAYLLKGSASSELVKAIRDVLRGKSYVTPKIAHRLEDDFVRDPGRTSLRELTSRQREVLRLLAEGRTMKEAAEVLNVTPRTIAFHKYRIMDDFGLRTNSDLVKFAIREKVISPR
jgi:DNA-binding NarL/FixJ family response regulator